MALGDENKRKELKELLEKSTISKATKQQVRDFIDELENGRLATLFEGIKRRVNS